MGLQNQVTTQRECRQIKAHLVGKGCTQKVGIDYSETFSPVVKFEIVRIVMDITVANDLKII